MASKAADALPIRPEVPEIASAVVKAGDFKKMRVVGDDTYHGLASTDGILRKLADRVRFVGHFPEYLFKNMHTAVFLASASICITGYGLKKMRPAVTKMKAGKVSAKDLSWSFGMAKAVEDGLALLQDTTASLLDAGMIKEKLQTLVNSGAEEKMSSSASSLCMP